MGGKAFGLAPAGGAGRQTDRGALIGGLRRTIARIEDRPVLLDARDGAGEPDFGVPDSGISGDERRPLPQGRVLLGIDEIDCALAGNGRMPGLEAAALHEVRAQGPDGAASATGFALALGGLLSRFRGPAFWITDPQPRFEAGDFCGPGLASLGFGPPVRVRARALGEALWAAGEIAATPGTGFCLLELQGNPAKAGLTFSRRLALRADASGTPVILLRQGGEQEASAALTRWRIAPAASSAAAFGSERDRTGFLGPPAFEAVLEKCRAGRTGRWILEWDCHERHFVNQRRQDRQAFGANLLQPGQRAA